MSGQESIFVGNGIDVHWHQQYHKRTNYPQRKTSVHIAKLYDAAVWEQWPQLENVDSNLQG